VISRFFFIILLIVQTNSSYGIAEYKIIATINNIAITNLDLNKEINVIKLLNKNNNLTDNAYLEQIAFKNLIDENIKLIEINNKKIEIESKKIKKFLNIFLNENKINQFEINKEILNLIEKKIKIDTSWRLLVNEMYGWKININIQEINHRVSNSKNNMSNQEKEALKQKLIELEKDKKLKVFDKYHFNKIKNNVLIKIY